MPSNGGKTTPIHASPKDVFTHLLAMIMLYASAISFLVLVFQWINLKVPDVLDASTPYRLYMANGLLRGSLAFLIIVYPVYLLSTWLLHRVYSVEPKKRDLPIRKWLLYFTLFVTALIIVGNLIALFSGFFRGELTARFLFKILAVFFVAGSIFGYYLMDLKRGLTRGSKMMAIGATVIVLFALIGGFWVMGSPAQQRLRRIDEQRVRDLQTMTYNMQNYYSQKKELPSALPMLRDFDPSLQLPRDPQTKQNYEYEVISDQNYKVCARFAVPSLGQNPESTMMTPYPYEGDGSWEHGAGRQCFERRVRTDVAPLVK